MLLRIWGEFESMFVVLKGCWGVDFEIVWGWCKYIDWREVLGEFLLVDLYVVGIFFGVDLWCLDFLGYWVRWCFIVVVLLFLLRLIFFFFGMVVVRKSRGKGLWYFCCLLIVSYWWFVCRLRIFIYYVLCIDFSWEKEVVKVCFDYFRNYKWVRDFCCFFVSFGYLECFVVVIWIDKNIDFIVFYYCDWIL